MGNNEGGIAWEGQECYFCHSQVEYCCDYCGTLVCQNHRKTDGQGLYFCSWNCCKIFHKIMKKKD